MDSRTGIPNRPVSNGSIMLPSPRTPVVSIGNVMQARPSIPDTRNAASPQAPEPLRHSLATSMNDTTASTTTVIDSRGSSRPFSSSHCRGTAVRIDAEAPIRLPMAAALTASIPLPFSRSRWPGSTDTASSPSGAPMNTDGTKSTKEWTTDAATMQQLTTNGTSSTDTCPANDADMAGYAVTSMAARVFTWIPGTRPLNSPMPAPAIMAARQIATRYGSMEHVSLTCS